MGRAGPVVESIIEENEQIRFLSNKDQASKRNAVELKAHLSFPDELLIMLGNGQQKAKLNKITCFHIFETLPQSKCAIAYDVTSLRNGVPEQEFIVIVFSTTAKQVLRILRAESEVT